MSDGLLGVERRALKDGGQETTAPIVRSGLRHTARLEWPQRASELALFALKRDELVAAGQRLAVPFDQLWFVIPGIDVTDRAGTENHEHALSLGREVRRTRGQRCVGPIIRQPF